jgi:energy-coupling factor transporter ATP-binding protein EcfA2
MEKSCFNFGPSQVPPNLTGSQRQAYASLFDYGSFYFQKKNLLAASTIRPRLFPLLAGPTGSGKSFLVESVAQALGAEYLHLTYGAWVPLGSRDPNAATLVRIAKLLIEGKRLLVHIDELDKWLTGPGSFEWGRSITTDLWNLLDCKIPFDRIPKAERKEGEPADPAEAGAEAPRPGIERENLFIVGSGTWQGVFENRSAPKIGFSQANPQAQGTEGLAEAVRASRMIPTELTARFATDILILTYPPPWETELLLEACGLKELARELGFEVSAKDVDFAAAGMRALESLATGLYLEKFRRDRRFWEHSWQSVEELQGLSEEDPGF